MKSGVYRSRGMDLGGKIHESSSPRTNICRPNWGSDPSIQRAGQWCPGWNQKGERQKSLNPTLRRPWAYNVRQKRQKGAKRIQRTPSVQDILNAVEHLAKHHLSKRLCVIAI